LEEALGGLIAFERFRFWAFYKPDHCHFSKQAITYRVHCTTARPNDGPTLPQTVSQGGEFLNGSNGGLETKFLR
jgi:hypothetical protein